MKIIHLSKRGYQNWEDNNLPLSLDNYIFLEDGWHFTMANYLKQNHPSLSLECWRVDEKVNEITTRESKNIKIKLIPDSKNDFFQLTLFLKNYF